MYKSRIGQINPLRMFGIGVFWESIMGDGTLRSQMVKYLMQDPKMQKPYPIRIKCSLIGMTKDGTQALLFLLRTPSTFHNSQGTCTYSKP